MSTTTAPPTDVPVDILASLLREHLTGQAIAITAHTSMPLAHQGTNDGAAFFRVTFTWTALAAARPCTTTWIVKHWRAGSRRDAETGNTLAREALAWEQGFLSPELLPAGVVVPIVGAWRSPDGTEAWLAMTDVSTELAAYPRLGLTGDQAIARARTILGRLASFHAAWEQPDRQAALQAARPWLGRPETYLGGPSGIDATWRVANEQAFLDARPSDERSVWERLLRDPQAVTAALAPYPTTLLHNDLDDRNIGLRWSGTAPLMTPPELVLIDWEWMAIGPAALDVAKVVQLLPLVITPGSSLPEAVWSDEVPDQYYTSYRLAGGRCLDPGDWQRAYGLARVAHGLAILPTAHGMTLRIARGELPSQPFPGVSAETAAANQRASLHALGRLGDLVIRNARRWLG